VFAFTKSALVNTFVLVTFSLQDQKKSINKIGKYRKCLMTANFAINLKIAKVVVINVKTQCSGIQFCSFLKIEDSE
jgi:hypothetical protein